MQQVPIITLLPIVRIVHSRGPVNSYNKMNTGITRWHNYCYI